MLLLTEDVATYPGAKMNIAEFFDFCDFGEIILNLKKKTKGI